MGKISNISTSDPLPVILVQFQHWLMLCLINYVNINH